MKSSLQTPAGDLRFAPRHGETRVTCHVRIAGARMRLHPLTGRRVISATAALIVRKERTSVRITRAARGSGRKAMTETELVVDLIYLSYFHNRKLTPDVTPEQWASIFGPRVKDLEDRFQAELEAAALRNRCEALVP
jgi:hypothetical protein